jgi:hypothetical protein
MTSRKLVPFPSILVILVSSLFLGAHPANADSSHARIIRLSLVQGDVRFARATHGDPLADSTAVWETAGLNLPIRQGYVLATDNGRAEVEFENGAVAFLKENTVLEFYDLSLKDSALTTRLVLRQGSASFYVNPVGGDYFSVTGGDFTVEADHRSSFRVDNYDNGSTLETYQGRVSVLHNKNTTRLEKGQSLSLKAGDDSSLSVGRLPDEDDFDRWVSGRVDSVSTATTAALQYTGSPYSAPGFADLYTYGAFSNCGAYGYGWRPFGVGYGWSPFTNGQWIMDPTFGYTWASYQPWGWAPYHYGGWLFDASCGGWFYSPPLLYGYPGYGFGSGRRFPRGVHPPQPIYHPVTAVFVRQGGTTGIVPMHPLDQKGKTPLNLERGVFSNVGTKGVTAQVIPVERGQKWETLKSLPREGLSGNLEATTAPARVSRSVVAGQPGIRAVSLGKDSSIAYDPLERRFVNTNSAAAPSSINGKEIRVENGRTSAATSTSTAVTPPHAPSAARSANSTAPARNTVPPPAPRYSGGDRGSSNGRGSSWGGSASSSRSSSGRSSSSPSSSVPSSHPSSGRAH